LGELVAGLAWGVRAVPIESKLRAAVRVGRLERAPGHMLDDLGLEAGVISAAEYEQLNDARDARDVVVQVDAFAPEVYRQLR
ncbi:MAG: acyl-CoA dehydrogenase domain-containing protein, partial [Mizugakiibacter sp.]|uniref:acyl-CoA dehydrogenase domain-containing protein n=1 Tax=Mizugakiibacter sp. TaxID=1972610 RepID=UPI00320D6694